MRCYGGLMPKPQFFGQPITGFVCGRVAWRTSSHPTEEVARLQNFIGITQHNLGDESHTMSASTVHQGVFRRLTQARRTMGTRHPSSRKPCLKLTGLKEAQRPPGLYVVLQIKAFPRAESRQTQGSIIGVCYSHQLPVSPSCAGPCCIQPFSTGWLRVQSV